MTWWRRRRLWRELRLLELLLLRLLWRKLRLQLELRLLRLLELRLLLLMPGGRCG